MVKFLVFVVSILCSSCAAQLSVNRTATLSPKTLTLTTPGVCPADNLRTNARDELDSEIRSLLSNLLIIDRPRSCSEVFQQNPNSPPGYYDIMPTNGSVTQVYCGMLPECCNDPTGWTQVAFINMTNSSYTGVLQLSER